MHKIFVGFDSSQAVAYDVLEYSIRRHAKEPVQIIPLRLRDLERDHGWKREWDPKQSTEFTYTRFLVPYLMGYQGIALFMDSDMLAMGDLSELFKLDMKPYALRVVKHDYQPAEGVKMGKLGKAQSAYPRKNWSSLMLMDCAKLGCWTKEAVETQSGAWLHRFEPIQDELIGEIDGSYWNVLDKYDEKTKLVHYTSGGPWTSYGDVWFQYKYEMERNEGKTKMTVPPKITVWQTGHVFNERLVAALVDGYKAIGRDATVKHASLYNGKPAPSISYGILRGVGRIYQDCAQAGVPWLNVDHGFFKPSDHKKNDFSGHYQIARGSLQALYERSSFDPSRWEKLGIKIKPWITKKDGYVLLCPPTPAMGEFYGVDPDQWAKKAAARFQKGSAYEYVLLRPKMSTTSLEKDLAGASLVYVYNSKVAIQALLEGIPAISEVGLIKSWNDLAPEAVTYEKATSFDREALFKCAAWLQFTLEEISSGFAMEHV